VLLGLVAGLAAVELGLRLLEPHDLRALHELRPDRPWLYGMQPNAAVRVGGITYATNADGFRDRTYPRATPPGTFRIVVLGDSIALGWGVALEESFPKRLEQRLGPSVQVLSLGVAGYNPYTEAQLFADVGVGYRPDLVLVEFCINDLNDPTLHFDASTMASLGALPEAAFPDPGRRRPAPGPAARLCRRLRTCALLADRLAPGPDAAALAAALATHDQPSAAAGRAPGRPSATAASERGPARGSQARDHRHSVACRSPGVRAARRTFSCSRAQSSRA
jgi:lysophospholipase L1-like esterase